ncbi:MAG: hypothetical protein KGO82_12215 [Bacteroidota bacterium]|nr:hypothetical protein [Bacteroidota bacterium]
MRDELSIIVHHDNLTVLVQVDAEPGQRMPQNKVVKALTGISDLKLFDWILLFHAFRIIRLKPITTKVMKEGVSFNPAEALESIFKHFRVTEDHNAVPTSY